MADVSQLQGLDGTVYNIKDATARSQSAGSGNAVVNITRNGTTFTATRADGTTFTFTQQDNDTKTTLQRIERTSADVTISGNDSTDVVFSISPPTGYTYLAVAGIEIRNSTNGGQGESHVCTGEFHTSDGLSNFHVYLHNLASSQAKVYVVAQFVVVNDGSLV